MKEYAIYPFEDMRVTQRHDQGNHIPHWKNTKDHSDKPWDEACLDGGRQYFVPQNDFIIEEILGLNTTATTNTIRLKSVNKVYMPYKKTADYLYVTLTHMNEETIKQLKKGQIIKKGQKIVLEGKDGATANHWHCTANTGKYYGFKKNSNGSWCYVYAKSLLPNEAFYLDTAKTVVRNANGYVFQNVPIVEAPKEPQEQTKVEDNTNTLEQPKTEPSEDLTVKKAGLWTRLIELIITLFEKIFKKNK